MKKLFILTLIFLTCGCYNYKELNDIAITSAIGIDKDEEGYKVTVQVINTQKSGGDESSTDGTKIVVYEQSGKTIQEAVRYMILESPKRLYPNHMQILLISEDVAREGIGNTLDLLSRDPEVQKDFYVLVTKDVSANDILKTLTPLDTIVSSNIQKTLKTDSNFLGISELITFDDLISDYLNKNIEISLPSITLTGNSEESDKLENIEQSDSDAKLVISEMTIFKDDKLLGYLDEKQSIFLSFAKGTIKNSLIGFEYKDGYINVECYDVDVSMDVDKSNNIKISIDGKVTINEVTSNVDLEKNKVIEKINNKLNSEIKINTLKTINHIRKTYNSDVFGFLDLIYKNNNSSYKKIKSGWYIDGFKNASISIESNIKVTEKGNIVRVIKHEE